MNYPIAILTLLLSLAFAANGQVFTKFIVSTTMSTFTQTVLTSTVCAKLDVNPMPVCRRLRHLWIEEPVFVLPEEHFSIQPTNTFLVEPTAVPWVRDDQNSGFGENLHLNFAHAIQPSLLMPVSDFMMRIPFESVNNGAVANLAQNRQLVTIITLTYTKPTTELETTTKTKTINVSGCTPVPFPYDVCV